MKNTTFIALLLVGAALLSCGKDAKNKLKSLDLMPQGVPISIMAPDSAEVKVSDLVVQKDVTIQKGEHFYVQIFMSDATAANAKALKAEQLEQVKTMPYFSKIIREDDGGFLYENKIDSTNLSYGFRHVRMQGDKEFIFQTGLIGNFSKEDAEAMYQAVQPKK